MAQLLETNNKSIKSCAMKLKKSNLSDYESTRSTNFFVGLLTVGGLCLAAFTYSNVTIVNSEKAKVKAIPIDYTMVEEKPIEQPKIKLPTIPKEEQKQQNTTINIQRDIDEKIISSTNTKTIIETEVTLGGLDIEFDKEIKNEIITDIEVEIIEIPEIEANFNGGYPALKKFIEKNLKYPQEAIEMVEQGIVYITFVVEKDGSISNVKALNFVSKSINAEAIRLVKSFPTWIPGEMHYGKVRTRMQLPLRFDLK